MASGPFTLGALARAAGMKEEDVRFYLQRGLLPGPRRRRGRSGDVAFHEEHVARLRFIARALAHGFTHDDIASFVDPRLLTCADVYRIAEKRLHRLNELLGEEAAAVAGLGRLMARCTRTGNRRDCTILADLDSGKGRQA